jgi:P4 family phage/plasmid primase-like protien
VKFSTVDDRHDNKPKPNEMNTLEFFEWIQEQATIGKKDGLAFIGSTFKKGGLRRLVDVEEVHALTIDVDHDVEDADRFLALFPYEGVAYSSFSHTEENPRFRVVIPYTEPIPPKLQVQVWGWANRHSGEVIDPKCKDATRLYYLPRYANEETEGIAWVKMLSGVPFNPYSHAAEFNALRVGRNSAVHEMAHRLMESGRTRDAALEACLAFQRAHEHDGDHAFTAKEVNDTVDSVYRAAGKPTESSKTDSKGRVYPNDMALAILGEHQIVRDPHGTCYEYNGRCWVEVTPQVLQRYALSADSHWASTQKRHGETISYLTASSQQVDEIPWGALPDHEVPLWSGVVDFVKKTQRPHNAEDWLESVIPHTWIEDAKCPRWYEALGRWFRCDPEWKEKLLALQEFFGYCLLTHAKYKKALVCYGDPNTGKSVVVTILIELVGSRNTCSIPVEQMDDPRALAPIKGMSLNVISDLTAKSMIADGGFKRLVSTGDAVSLDEKYKTPELYVPHAKHVVATNVLPGVSDKTWATFERMMLLKFPNAIPVSEQDRNLVDALKEELPGILCWSIEGAVRLVENHGQFTVIPESDRLLAEYREEQNPVYGFLEERCIEDDNATTPFHEFYAKFVEWHGNRIARITLGRWLLAAGVKTEKIRTGHRLKRCVIGYIVTL